MLISWIQTQRKPSTAVLSKLWTCVFIACCWNGPLSAQGAPIRMIPSRAVPIPNSVSPELQKLLGQPADPSLPPPKTTEEWRTLTEQPRAAEEASSQELMRLRRQYGVTMASEMMSGVRCYIITPSNMKPEHRSRLIFNLHHGGFIAGGGESGTGWGIALAGLTGYRVVVVDYRLLPEHPFPAAQDDATAVWKHLVKSHKPTDIAIVGGSAGGGLTLSLVQRLTRENLPVPGAMVVVSPAAADLSKGGDSYYTNAGVDSLVYDGFWEGVLKFYANGRDLKDPEVSPVYGDFKGFPPSYLVTGTRDIFLSDTARVQRKLLQAGVPTQLVVGEGLPHVGPFIADIPEVAEIYTNIGRYLDTTLGK